MEIKRCRKNSFRRALRRGHDPSKVSTAIGWLRLFSVSRSTCKKAYDATQQKGHHVVTTRNSLGIQLHHVKRTAPITH